MAVDVHYQCGRYGLDRRTGLLGLGTPGAGPGLVRLLGGDLDNLSGYRVHMSFHEPTEAVEDEEGHVR